MPARNSAVATRRPAAGEGGVSPVPAPAVAASRPVAGRQSGVVLLETLVAILIFSLGILGIIGLQAGMISGASEAKYRTEAGFFANRLLADMAAADRSSMAAMSVFATSGARYTAWYNQMKNTAPSAGLLGLPGADANPPTVTITPVANATGNPARYDVRVTVRWQSPGQPVRRHEVLSSISAD